MGAIHSGSRCITSEQLNLRARCAASGLGALGITAGDTIALYLRNDLALFEATLAAGMLGAYPVPVNWHYVEDEARYVFHDAQVKAIVIHADLLRNIAAAIPEGIPVLVVPTPPEIAQAYDIRREQCAPGPGMLDWNEWLERHPPFQAPAQQARDSMIYTSGTTGRPKGVRRQAPTSEESLFQEFVRARGFGFSREQGADIVTVVTGPMYHNAPNAYGLIAARYGGTVILQPRFDARELLRLIQEFRVTHLQMVPVMFNRLLALPDDERKTYDLSSLQVVVHSAAPVSPEVKRLMLSWWGPIINEYYGTTETGMMAFCTAREWLAHPGAVGKVLPEADLKIVDADGKEMPPGTPGEIICWVRGVPDFTYHNDDDKRQASFRGSRFSTGDVGYVSEDGFLYLCDRVKDLLISGGVNIYPAEIEAVLIRMPGVGDCAVFGIPDAEFGEAVCAVVQPAEGSDITAQDVKGYLRARIAGYKVPRVVEFRDELPREDSGKIFKRKIREQYWMTANRRI